MTNLKIADRLGEVKEYYFSKKLAQIDEMRRAGFDVINLGIGSPDLPPHPSVVVPRSPGCAYPRICQL